VAVEGYQKEKRHIQNLLDNWGAVHIALMVALDGRRMYLGAEYLQMVVVGYSEARRKMAAGLGGERTAEIDGLHNCLGAGCLHMVAVERLTACRKLIVSSAVLRKKVVVSCRIETEVDFESKDSERVDCMMYETFHWVDRRLEVLNQCSHPVAHYEMNNHNRLPAVKRQ
jgi:hypothetical protein